MSTTNNLYEKVVWICYVFYLFTIIAFGDRSQYYMISNLTFILLLGLISMRVLASRKLHIPKDFFCLFPFVGYCYLSVIWSSNRGETLTRANTMAKLLVLFFLLAYYLRITQEYANYIKGFAIAGLLVLMYVVSFYGLSGLRLMMSDNIRVGTEIVNSNSLAIFMAISALILFYTYLNNKNRIVWIPMAFLIAIIALTGSKKGLIDLIIGFPLVMIVSENSDENKRNRDVKVFTGIIIMLAVAYILWNMPIFNTVRHRFQIMFHYLSGKSSIMDYSTKERRLMLIAGLRQFIKTPVIGIGIAASDAITQSIFGRATYLHNNYVELLATGGIIAFLLYYIPIIKIIVLNYRRRGFSYTSGIMLVLGILILVNDFAAVQYFSKIVFILLAIGINAIYEIDPNKISG